MSQSYNFVYYSNCIIIREWKNEKCIFLDNASCLPLLWINCHKVHPSISWNASFVEFFGHSFVFKYDSLHLQVCWSCTQLNPVPSRRFSPSQQISWSSSVWAVGPRRCRLSWCLLAKVTAPCSSDAHTALLTLLFSTVPKAMSLCNILKLDFLFSTSCSS